MKNRGAYRFVNFPCKITTTRHPARAPSRRCTLATQPTTRATLSRRCFQVLWRRSSISYCRDRARFWLLKLRDAWSRLAVQLQIPSADNVHPTAAHSYRLTTQKWLGELPHRYISPLHDLDQNTPPHPERDALA